MHDDWKYIFDEYGLPQIYEEANSEIIESLPKNYPLMLRQYVEVHGRSSLNDKMFQICLPNDFTFIEDAIRDFLNKYELGFIFVYAHSAFGEIYFWTEKYGEGYLRLIENEMVFNALFDENLIINERCITIPFGWGIEPGDVCDAEGKDLYKKARKKCGALDYGECYGFVPAVAFGGIESLETVKRMDAKAHFSILLQAQPMTIKRVIIRPPE